MEIFLTHKTEIEGQRLLGLAGYLCKFIKDFAITEINHTANFDKTIILDRERRENVRLTLESPRVREKQLLTE